MELENIMLNDVTHTQKANGSCGEQISALAFYICALMWGKCVYNQETRKGPQKGEGLRNW